MNEMVLRERMVEFLAESGVAPDVVGDLAGQLLWRIGRIGDDEPVTVRVGLASSAALFHDLPRLRSASDGQLERSVLEGTLHVEWVGARPKTAGER